MGLLTNLLLGLIHLLLVAIDILFLLLLATMLSYRWQPPWLTALCSAGRPVVGWLTRHLERGFHYLGRQVPSERTVLFIAILAVWVLRLLLALGPAR